jgi:hypothetical protein
MSSVLEILSINELYVRRDNLLKQLKKVDEEISFRKIDISNITPKDDISKDISNITPKDDISKGISNITPKDDISKGISNITPKDDISKGISNITPKDDNPIEVNKSLKKIKIIIKKTIKS